MTDLKIGDRVALKGKKEQLGYVSHIHKGHMFELDDYVINIHLGNQEHIEIQASKLERYNPVHERIEYDHY